MREYPFIHYLWSWALLGGYTLWSSLQVSLVVTEMKPIFKVVKKISGLMKGGPLGFMVIMFLKGGRQEWLMGRGVGKGDTGA